MVAVFSLEMGTIQIVYSIVHQLTRIHEYGEGSDLGFSLSSFKLSSFHNEAAGCRLSLYPTYTFHAPLHPTTPTTFFVLLKHRFAEAVYPVYFVLNSAVPATKLDASVPPHQPQRVEPFPPTMS
jgi:hypothetical protein